LIKYSGQGNQAIYFEKNGRHFNIFLISIGNFLVNRMNVIGFLASMGSSGRMCHENNKVQLLQFAHFESNNQKNPALKFSTSFSTVRSFYEKVRCLHSSFLKMAT